MIDVNQNDASQVVALTSMFKPNNVFSDKIVAIGPPITIASATNTMNKIFPIINPIKF